MKKRMFQTAVCGLFSLLGCTLLQAQEEKMETLEEMVISATRFPMKKAHTGKIIYRFTPADLAHFRGSTLTEVLTQISSININGSNSAPGKNKSVYIRGSRGRQVLVLIDGVPMTDPSGVSAAFDLRLISMSQVAAIEVMNGAAGTLYGSGAAAGIVNIQLKKPTNTPFSLSYDLSAGTVNTQENTSFSIGEMRHQVAVSGSLKGFTYLASLQHSGTDGFSEAKANEGEEAFEEDTFGATHSLLRIGYQPTDKMQLQGFVHDDRNHYDYDAGAFVDSEINRGENRQQRIGFSARIDHAYGKLHLTAAYNNILRSFDSYNSWSMATDHFEYIGKSHTLDLVNSYQLGNGLELIAGIAYQRHSNQTNSPYGTIDASLANFSLIDPYATVVYQLSPRMHINAGLRLNHHSSYGNHWVYHFNPSLIMTEKLQFIASYSTAFISPTSYQLFSNYGNKDLTPETGQTSEFGLRYHDRDRAVEWNTVFFYRVSDNAIVLPDYISYQNAEDTCYAKGVETEFKKALSSSLSIRLGHTYTHKNKDLDYLPTHKWTGLLETTLGQNTYLSLRYQNTAPRDYFDQWGTGETISLEGYQLVDLYGSRDLIAERLSVYLQISNLFNEDYVETIGYNTRGRNVKMGLHFNF